MTGGHSVRAHVVALGGDGVGTEVMREALRVLDLIGARFSHSFEVDHALVGGAAIDACGDPLPNETRELVASADAVLLGAVGGPKWDDPSATVRP